MRSARLVNRMSPDTLKLAPRIWVFSPGTATPPTPSDGVLALAQVADRAFGDGRHPTTRLCAGALDVLMRNRRPKTVLDVGTGTGILARIARARGADRVTATDVDPVALTSAKRNFALDAHGCDIQLHDGPPDAHSSPFDLIVANILEEPLTMLAPALARALNPNGRLLISGFTPPQAPTLRVTYKAVGLDVDTEARLEDWVLLALRPSR